MGKDDYHTTTPPYYSHGKGCKGCSAGRASKDARECLSLCPELDRLRPGDPGGDLAHLHVLPPKVLHPPLRDIEPPRRRRRPGRPCPRPELSLRRRPRHGQTDARRRVSCAFSRSPTPSGPSSSSSSSP